jgi:magnesium transporter
MTVVVRGIGLGELGWETSRRVVIKEALVGLVNGLIVGLAVCLIVGIWFWARLGSARFGATLGGVLGVTTLLSLFVAGTLGTFIPVLLAVQVDPALASSVFVVAFTDVSFSSILDCQLLLKQFKLRFCLLACGKPFYLVVSRELAGCSLARVNGRR